MAKFYLIGKISEELMKRMQNDPSADRFASTKKATEAAGLKLISYEWGRINGKILFNRQDKWRVNEENAE